MGNEQNQAAPGGQPETKVLTVEEGPVRPEVSATTVGRMLGLVTLGDIKVYEGKLDLMMTKVNNMAVRVEKAVSLLNSMPTGADLERIDVQIGSLKAALGEIIKQLPDAEEARKEAAQRTAKAKIIASSPAAAPAPAADASEEEKGS